MFRILKKDFFRSVKLSSFSLVEEFLLEDGWLGETKSNLMGGKLVIAVGNGIELALHNILIEWIKIDLLVLLTVKGNSNSSSANV